MGEKQMTRPISKGECSLCNNTFTKVAMTKHLKSCRLQAVSKTQLGGRSPQKTNSLHIVVEGRYAREYWMHLETPSNATLQDLDNFLRDTWLECCGHLSAFTIQGTRYEVMEDDFMEVEQLMDVALGDVLSPGIKFSHEYDFGTTTELALKVISEQEGEIKGKSIQLLARNDPPSISCELCGKIATQVCGQCVWSGEGWLCSKCAGKHGCGEEMFLPVVNSPRVGMCGYAG